MQKIQTNLIFHYLFILKSETFHLKYKLAIIFKAIEIYLCSNLAIILYMMDAKMILIINYWRQNHLYISKSLDGQSALLKLELS